MNNRFLPHLYVLYKKKNTNLHAMPVLTMQCLLTVLGSQYCYIDSFLSMQKVLHFFSYICWIIVSNIDGHSIVLQKNTYEFLELYIF